MKKLILFLFIVLCFYACSTNIGIVKTESYSDYITFSSEDTGFCSLTDKEFNVYYRDTIIGEVIIINRINQDISVDIGKNEMHGSGNMHIKKESHSISLPSLTNETYLFWWNSHGILKYKLFTNMEGMSICSKIHKENNYRILSTTKDLGYCTIIDSSKKIVYSNEIKGSVLMINKSDYKTFLIWWDYKDSLQTRMFDVDENISVHALEHKTTSNLQK